MRKYWIYNQRQINSLLTHNPAIVNELGERLYEKITEVVTPEWEEAFKQMTKQDCIDYIYNLTIKLTSFIAEQRRRRGTEMWKHDFKKDFS